MTENQNNIVGKVLIDAGVMTIPITEDWISMMVDLYIKQGQMLGIAPLTDEEKDEVIATLHASLFVRIDRGHCLKEKDHTPWYMAAKAELPGKFWDRYRIYLQKEQHWNKDTVNELDKTTDEIMDLLGNPSSANSYLYRGLCIGDVQSGKTSTYIGLINKAADAQYRVVILLTGTIEKLRRQTQQRIDEGFIGLDSYAFTLENDNVQVGVGTIDSTTSGWAVTSTTSDFNAATAKKIVGQLNNISAPVIFVLKKNKSVLEKLEHWLRFYNANKITKKIDLPMLLIDDEADNASVNTKKDKSEVTAINKGIRKLLVLFEKANYVGFTATPYANIFIDPDTEQEMLDHDLFPRDFIYALEAPSNYIGARSIFAKNAKYSYMLESNDDCEPALPMKHKKEDVLTYIPKSLEEAIGAFFVCNAIRDLRGDTKSHRTMMINISMATDKLRAEVRRMQNDDMTPTQFGLAVRSDITGLLITARNKMRDAKDYETVVNFSGEVVETRYVHSSKDILRRNYEETDAFLQEIKQTYSLHKNDPELALKANQFLNVKKEAIMDFLSIFSAHTLNIDFSITELLGMFREDTQNVFDNWDILVAGGSSTTPEIQFGGLSIPPVRRGFAYRKDTKSLQMSGKNSRLGSKDLAKGGLTKKIVEMMEAGQEEGKAFSEDFYFSTGMKRNPLMVIYPVKLSYEPKEGETVDEIKKRIAESIDFPIIGLSIGIPLIAGKKKEKIKYKVNKQKWLELFGVDDGDDFEEIDETIPEE